MKKTNEQFKDKARTNCLWERLRSSCKLSVTVSKKTEIQDTFNFLKNLIRRKGISKSSTFKSRQRGACAVVAHNISQGSVDTDATHQPSICSTASESVVFQPPLVDQQVIDQFACMKTMLISLFGSRQEVTKTPFCNYLAS